jgi:hypothetical protein
MEDIATILGKAKQAEIKQALQKGSIVAYVTYLVKESDFRFTPETRWAYTGVATYLDDGWTAQQGWTTLAEHCLLTKDELGQAMNQLVGGTRYDWAHADSVKAPWTGAGLWPTRADLGAFMFYVSVTQRAAHMPPRNPGGMLVNPGFSE